MKWYWCRVVEAFQHGVGVVEDGIIVVFNALIAPSADRLVGGELLGVEKLAHKTRSTAIETIDVAVAVSTALSGYSHIGVALVEQIIAKISAFCSGVRIDHRYVQVVSTRGQSQG